MIVRIPKKDGMHRDLDVKPELVYDLPLVRQATAVTRDSSDREGGAIELCT